MKNLSVFCLLLFFVFSAKAQYKFLANNSSEQFKAKIFVDNCDKNLCDGKATIILYDKISDREIQTFQSDELDFTLTEKQDARIGWLDLGKYQSPLIFGDFNFDGNEDIAIRNGSKGIYMNPSFDIYLFTNNKFVLNTALTKLATENLGMFDVNKKQKELSIHLKSGCCFHKTISYKVSSKNTLLEVSSVIEDSSIGDDVTVITQKLINGKTQKTVQKFKTKDYYEQ